ncbi:manganese transporter [Rubrobacter taiwanensis]|uniref:Manganese transporter n=1 Tax=Rubrobacter taiwanensis TaxID=185139 RepID=A0A4R1BSE7_9ACTN|nr:zinc ABC transporter substrate-binding protein [Rubrobacter taiwanensis]TCJ20759.1 manganese transporter [Rubrobacter taiwanensis]
MASIGARLRWFFLALTVVVALALAVGCGGDGEAGASEEGLRVTTTTTMITDLVERIGGDRVEVTGLMGPGVDPHLYRASQSDVEALAEADVVFYNGLFLEGRMQDVLIRTGQQTPTVQVTGAIPEGRLLESEEYEGQYDPHVWFDVELWAMTVDPVVEKLSELDPENASFYEQNGEAYKRELAELDSWVREQIETIPAERRVLVTAHDAFRYFGRAYGIEVRGIQGISTEVEAGARDIQEVAEFVAENEIPAIFVEGSVPPQNIEAVQAAARDRGWEVEIGGELFSDAMGEPGTEEGTYVGMVRHNVNAIVEALA